jgi:deaminated glutathione amidase
MLVVVERSHNLPQALFLPEASDYIASSTAESLSLCKPVRESPFVLGLQKTAREQSLPINVGIHEPTEPPSKRIRNTLIWIDTKGDITHRYQKLHMFDIDLRPDGPHLKESDSSEPGPRIEEPYVAEYQLGNVGSLICFDLRFPEPAISLRRRGADIILYPSAFTVPTGKLHWETLLRSRAMETQSYVLAAAQCGKHNGKRVSYGDTIAIDPNGKVLGRLEKVEDVNEEKEGARQPDLLLADIDLESVKKVRKGIPLLRRDDVYGRL